MPGGLFDPAWGGQFDRVLHELGWATINVIHGETCASNGTLCRDSESDILLKYRFAEETYQDRFQDTYIQKSQTCIFY